MIEFHLRSKIQPACNLIGLFLFNVHPNTITTAAFIFGMISALSISMFYAKTAVIFLLISGIADMLDGTVARLQNISSPVGAYIDLVSDRMVEAGIIAGFTAAYPQHYIAYIIFLAGVIFHFSTFVAAGALFKNTGAKSMHHDHSIVERAEAFITFALMMLFPTYIFELLMLFNVIMMSDAASRFIRVIRLRS